MSGWNNIIGHEWAIQLLNGAIKNDRVGHAYLITGAEQIGKTVLARTFAQGLNCEASLEDRPCGHCRSCLLIASDRHPDVRLVQPESSDRGKLSIKIDQVRALQGELNLAPFEGRYRVAILKRFDTANINAANAFLKTLEEPPANAVLILTALDMNDLLPTIVSRCQSIGLRTLQPELIEENLMTLYAASPEDALLLSHLSGGRIGWAIAASQDQNLLKERHEHLALLREAISGSRVRRFALAETLARKPEQLPLILRTWLGWWHDLSLLAYRNHEYAEALPINNIDFKQQLEELAGSWSKERILAAFKQTELALWQLERNANTRLTLESLLLIYPMQGKKVEA